MRTMTLSLPAEIDDFLNTFASEQGISKAKAMKGAFALLKLAYDQKQKGDGSSLGLVKRMPDNSLRAIGVVTGVR